MQAKRKWLFLMIPVFVLVVAGMVLLGGRGIEFPYGIRHDMSLNEMRVKMEDAGIAYSRTQEYSGRTTLFFDTSYVNGVTSDFATIEYERGRGTVDLNFFFIEGKEFGRQNVSGTYTELKEWLLKTYGKPATDMDGLCRWEKGHMSLCLSYADRTGGNLSLSYDYEP